MGPTGRGPSGRKEMLTFPLTLAREPCFTEPVYLVSCPPPAVLPLMELELHGKYERVNLDERKPAITNLRVLGQ